MTGGGHRGGRGVFWLGSVLSKNLGVLGVLGVLGGELAPAEPAGCLLLSLFLLLQPGIYQPGVIPESQFFLNQVCRVTQSGQLLLKPEVFLPYYAPARNAGAVRGQPIPNGGHQALDAPIVRLNVLTCYVGYELLIPVKVPVEHQALLPSLFPSTKFPSSQEYPKFQRHIEPGQSCGAQFSS